MDGRTSSDVTYFNFAASLRGQQRKNLRLPGLGHQQGGVELQLRMLLELLPQSVQVCQEQPGGEKVLSLRQETGHITIIVMTHVRFQGMTDNTRT